MPRVPALRRLLADGSNTESRDRDRPEDIPLLLPSSLSAEDRAALPPQFQLVYKEGRLRRGQADDRLNQLRRLLRVRTSLYSQKKAVAVGQRENTRANSTIAGFNDRIQCMADQYRVAHAALQALDPDGEWSQTLRSLLPQHIQGPDGSTDVVPVRHKKNNPRTRQSEGRRELSWIWLAGRLQSDGVDETTTSGGVSSTNVLAPDDANQDNDDGLHLDPDENATMKAEWCKTYARVERWEEELALVQEEMRRTLAYCEWKMTWWKSQATQRADVTPAVADGLTAYAMKQAAVWDGLGLAFARKWAPLLRDHNFLHEWPTRFAHPVATSSGSEGTASHKSKTRSTRASNWSRDNTPANGNNEADDSYADDAEPTEIDVDDIFQDDGGGMDEGGNLDEDDFDDVDDVDN